LPPPIRGGEAIDATAIPDLTYDRRGWLNRRSITVGEVGRDFPLETHSPRVQGLARWAAYAVVIAEREHIAGAPSDVGYGDFECARVWHGRIELRFQRME